MANSRQGGAFGFLRKSIGSVTYSTIKDGKGKRIQVARSKPVEVANPNTVGQIIQRMKVKPAARFFNAFAEILDNAFEGVAYGPASRRHFMGLAMSQTGPYIPKGATRFIPAKYPVSEGSAASPSFNGYGKFPNQSVRFYGVNGFYMNWDGTDVAEGGTLHDKAIAVYGRDVQITVLAVTQASDGTFVPHYGRVLTSDYTTLPSNGVINLDGFYLLERGSYLSVCAGVGDDDPESGGDPANEDFTGIVAAAIIISYKEGENWIRTNTVMGVNDALDINLYGNQALQNAIESYQSATAANALNSTWYLNLANGQPYPGQLRLMPGDLSFTVQEETVIIQAVAPVGRKVNENGYLVESMFANANGDAIFYVNGQYTTIQNPEEATGTYVKAADVALMFVGSNRVETWQDSYALQIQA